MQERSGHGSVAELATEPGEVTRRIRLRRRVRLHLDGHDPAAGELGDEVDLVTTLLRPEVVQTRSCLGEGQFENSGLGNEIFGLGGKDSLSGGSGDGDGADQFDGGAGIDTIDYGNNTLSTVVDLGVLNAVTVNNGVTGENDQFYGATIENAILGTGDDMFTGSAFNNIVWPNGGQNALTGGPGGIDTVNYSQGYTAGVLVNLSGGGAAGGNQDSITGFTNAVGTAFNDTLIGTDVVGGTNGANLLVGGKGNDNISGNAGPDLVRAGAGNDNVRGGNGDDDLFGQGGNDFIRGGNGDDNIIGGKGKDRCIGGGGRDKVKCEKAQKSRSVSSARLARAARLV